MSQVERMGVIAAVVAAMLGVSHARPPGATTRPADSRPARRRPYEIIVPPGDLKTMGELPLVIYLHGSKSPQLDRAKADYAALLANRRCLLVMPRSMGKEMWLAGEEKYVMDVLAEVQVRHSVDSKRIILLGVSGGAVPGRPSAGEVPGGDRRLRQPRGGPRHPERVVLPQPQGA